MNRHEAEKGESQPGDAAEDGGGRDVLSHSPQITDVCTSDKASKKSKLTNQSRHPYLVSHGVSQSVPVLSNSCMCGLPFTHC